MKKWFMIILSVCLIGIAFFSWQKNTKLNTMGEILSNVETVNSITIREGKTSEEIVTMTEGDPIFHDLKESYRNYHDLSWKNRKLLNNDPVYEIDYFISNERLFTIDLYAVDDDQDSLSSGYYFSPDNSDRNFIIAITELNQLVRMTEGIKELLNMIE